MATNPMLPYGPSEPTPTDLPAFRGPDELLERLPTGVAVLEWPSMRLARANAALRRLCARAFGRETAAWDGRLLAWLEERGLLTQIATALALDCAFPRQVVACADMADESSLWLAVEAVPLMDDGRASVGVREALLHLTDCTDERRERLRAERALYSAQLYAEGLEAALEHLTDGVAILDAAGHIRAYNRAALAYARNRRAVERARTHGIRLEPIWALRWPDGTAATEIERPEWRAMLTGAPRTGVEMLLERERGGDLPVRCSAAPLRDELGGIAGVVVAYHDMSAIKEIERLKDEFISTASHELRQPLTVIQGQAQLLNRHLARAEHGLSRSLRVALTPPVASIAAQTSRLNALVSDLLDVSRLQAGQLQVETAPMPLVELVRGVVEQQRGVSSTHPIELRAEPAGEEGALVVACDRRRIEQVLMNLLSNAIKYSPDGGVVTVTVGELAEGDARLRAVGCEHPQDRPASGPFALVCVRDVGIGIPRELLSHLFERFFRAPNTSGIQGTGLGLYICRKLARAHGGDLWVNSAGEGAGTTFSLALPLAPPVAKVAPPRPTDQGSDRRRG